MHANTVLFLVMLYYIHMIRRKDDSFNNDNSTDVSEISKKIKIIAENTVHLVPNLVEYIYKLIKRSELLIHK